MDKKLYILRKDDDDNTKLLLTEDQAAMFYYFKYNDLLLYDDYELIPAFDTDPIEITAEKYHY